MRLEPKAKPIKIRIMMGGEEHSTLEGVKRCFSLNELMPLIADGRFERWLDQIGEKDKADQIREKKSDWNSTISENAFKEILCILFEQEYSNVSLLNIVKSWEKDSSFTKVTKDVLIFLSKSDFEAAKYYYLRDKDADEPWQEIFSSINELNVLMDLYRDERTREVFKGKKWGSQFAPFVTDVASFEDVFEFLKSTSCNVDVMSSFCNNNDQIEVISHKWIAGKDLYHIKSYYRDETVRVVFRKYWPILFSEFVKDESSFEQILQWIQTENDADLENQFLVCCAENNIEKAKRMVDPWYVLAGNDIDYEIVRNCLNNYSIYTDYYSYSSRCDVSIAAKLSTPLAFQILDFLVQMKHFKGEYGEWGSKSYMRFPATEKYFYPYYLGREKYILECSKKNQLKQIREDLFLFKKDGCILAEEILKEYDNSKDYYGNKSYPSFLRTQELMFLILRNQIKKAKHEL